MQPIKPALEVENYIVMEIIMKGKFIPAHNLLSIMP
jgi:hypothetical protein